MDPRSCNTDRSLSPAHESCIYVFPSEKTKEWLMRMMKFVSLNLPVVVALTMCLATLRVFGHLSPDDVSQADVLRRIHQINLTEIAAGDLAQNKGHSASTRNYGEMLVTDHSKAEEKVKQLAKQEKINLNETTPNAVEAQKEVGEALVAELRKTTGSNFDRTFVQRMDTAHSEAIASLEKAQTQLQGTPTASLIRELLPQLRKHEHMAATIERAE